MDREQGQGKRERAEEESTEGASTFSFMSPISTDVCSSQYDVFLSFRGLDTRKAFTDHLYHSLIKAGTVPVWVFKDDNSIPIGEKFGSKILDAITRSKISIPIISENYASSKWCLRELIHIMDCKKRTSHIVLPIFYKVDPADVRYQKGSFGEAFHLRKKRFDEMDIQEGLQALREVSDLHGWESKKFANGHEGELVEKVVKNILSKLQQDFQLDVTKHLVGIEDHVNKIKNWVDTPASVARMIGIYGMGGIGKTTLAKKIYNQLLNDFVHHSFLADIRETAYRHGIPHLQKQLINTILQNEPNVWNVDDGISLIKSRFKGKKVLILLDDIDDKNQLDVLARECNWFVAGSLIIVTTRNKAILDQSEFEVDFKYELTELDKVQALLLFNRHAFRMDYPPRDFDGISRDIISTMGGLPLALQVVGSYLYKKTNPKVWEDVRKQLKNQPHKDVQKILQISYDALEDGHKQIFLDIVCFFIGETSEYAMYMWEDCEFYPNQGIEELKLRCLIKIGDDGEFTVHDQLRDLGRSIWRQGQPLEKCRGPWDYNYEGVPRVVRDLETYPWFHDFLGAASSGDSKFSEVRWLQWGVRRNDASLSTINFHLPKLSVLDLWERKEYWKGITEESEEDSEGITEESEEDREGITEEREGITEDWEGITEDWEGWNSLKASKQLKVLIVQNSSKLRCTPDLSAFMRLKILRLRECYLLEHLHPSIGELTSLVTLDLYSCRGLKELPEEVGGLKDLEELILDESGITAIPSSIGSLRKLKTLSAKWCKSLREIPSSIGDLQNLQRLDLSFSAIEKLLTPISDLPKSIRNLSSLQSLDLWGCKELRSLPELPSGLTCLWVTCQSLGLPQLFSLIRLEELSLDVLHLLEDIYELSSIPVKLCFEERDKLTSLRLDGPTYLEELSIEKCNSIKYLTLSRLSHLKIFRVEQCNSLVQIHSHDDLVCLEVIFLYDCNSIRYLLCPRSRYLKKLVAVECDNLVGIQGLDGVEFLEELDFTGCKSMETLPDLTRCEKLRSLRVRDCKKLTQLQGLKKLNLIDLDISGCDSLVELSIKKCSSIERLELPQLFRLKQLQVEHCDSLIGIWGCDELESLEVICLYDCNSIKSLFHPKSRCLKILVAVGCDNLVEIEGLDSAEFLEELDFTGCKSMETLPNLTGCEKLQSLRVRDCKKLTKLQGLEKLNLIDLDISGCDSLEAIPNLSGTRIFRNYELPPLFLVLFGTIILQ